MFNTRNPKRNIDCRKAGHRPLCLQNIDAAIRIRGTNH